MHTGRPSLNAVRELIESKLDLGSQAVFNIFEPVHLALEQVDEVDITSGKHRYEQLGKAATQQFRLLEMLLLRPPKAFPRTPQWTTCTPELFLLSLRVRAEVSASD